MGICLTPVRTRRICMHAFGLTPRGLVSTHLLKSVITSPGAVYPHDSTRNPGLQVLEASTSAWVLASRDG